MLDNVDKFEDYFKKIIDQDRYNFYSSLDPNKYSVEDSLKVINILRRDCHEYLEEIKSGGHDFFFRGVSGGWNEVSDGIYLKKTRKDRIPRDTMEDFSKSFDSFFEDQFGVRVRSEGFTVTKDPMVARYYSQNVFLFFPIGEYRYFWNPNVIDLFKYVREEDWYWDDYSKDPQNFEMKTNGIVSGYREGGIGLIEGQEVNFVCDQYYLVDPNLLHFLKSNL